MVYLEQLHQKYSDGTVVAKKMKVLNYTGRLVVGSKRYLKELLNEESRVIPMIRKFGGPGKGYKEYYGITYRDEVRKVVDKKFCLITEFMDHCIIMRVMKYLRVQLMNTTGLYFMIVLVLGGKQMHKNT